MKDNRIFKSTEVDPNAFNMPTAWICDLSKGDAVNPDCYWYFTTRKQAQHFASLVDSGVSPRDAAHIVDPSQ